MSDRWMAALAVAAWSGALIPFGASWELVILSAGITVAGLWRRSPWIVVFGVALVASTASGVTWAGLDAAGSATRFEGTARLLSDPQPVAGGVRVDAEIDGQRIMLRAWGSSAGHLRPRLMGEDVVLDVQLRPLGDAPEWLRARGVTGRGTVTSVQSFGVGQLHTRVANSIRRTIESGAASLTRDERSLFAGLVYGDDREQSPLVADNFQAGGLSHLLAVSGQNVAFVLAIVGPLLRRLGYRQRFFFVLAVLVLFATVTRFEPSVLRASVMTAVAAVAALIGSEVSGLRMLALAVTALVVVDPLIVHSVAFQLSVAASTGILLWSGRVARALPGPRFLIEALAVTSAAQLAVAPLLVWRFDGLPVASLPANLLAGPVAGPVMMWGLTAGLFAGVVPTGLAEVMHWPTRFALWWIDAVAGVAAETSLGSLGGVHVIGLFAAAVVALRTTRPKLRRAVVGVGLALLAHPGIALAMSTPTSQSIDGGSAIWRDTNVTIVELAPASRPEDVLAALRSVGVGDIDLLISRRSSYANAQLIRWIETRHHVVVTWAPEQTMGVGEQVPADTTALVLDDFTLIIEPAAEELTITASPS